MKHTLKITLLLIGIFILAQLTGIVIVGQYIDIKGSAETGKTQLHEEQYIIEPPMLKNESTSFLYIIVAIIIGTILVLILIKYQKRRMWKAWYLVSVVICLTMAFAPFMRKLLYFLFPTITNYYVNISVGLALLLGLWKITKPNVIIHNVTEIFIYGGVASLLVPIINLFSGFALLVIISLYDAYAVWKSKHMVKMAKFQSNTNVFAGLFIPYKRERKEEAGKAKTGISMTKVGKIVAKKESKQPTNAVLGGGDIAFPLLFSSAVLKTTGNYGDALTITLFAALALFLLFCFSKSNKFYPAMPFISGGCFLGFIASMLL